MRVTSKGQVTIPRHVREELRITTETEVDFERQPDGSYRLAVRPAAPRPQGRFRSLRGVATVRMTTDEIMRLTRGT